MPNQRNTNPRPPNSLQGRLRFLRRQHQALRTETAEAQRALAAVEWEREELEEGAGASVRRVEEEQARKAQGLQARIEAVQRELRAFERPGTTELDDADEGDEGEVSEAAAVATTAPSVARPRLRMATPA